jgi:hypothetical protein
MSPPLLREAGFEMWATAVRERDGDAAAPHPDDERER